MTNAHDAPIRRQWEHAIRDAEMKPEHKLLGLILATYANYDGANIRPGDERLAIALNVSRRTIIRHRQALIEMGWIRRTRVRRSMSQTDTYRLTLPDC